jgi:hypothetical protein
MGAAVGNSLIDRFQEWERSKSTPHTAVDLTPPPPGSIRLSDPPPGSTRSWLTDVITLVSFPIGTMALWWVGLGLLADLGGKRNW